MSAGLPNLNWHFLVRLGKVDFAKSKKIIESPYLLIVYGQKSNVRTMNRVHNGPCRQRKVIQYLRFTTAEHCAFGYDALHNAPRIGLRGTNKFGKKLSKQTKLQQHLCSSRHKIHRMQRFMLKSKIHRAKITQADVHYEGSLTLDLDLLQAGDIVPYEEVHVWNVTRGTRFRTYAMLGPKGSGMVCANGAAALLALPNDLIIIATFTMINDQELGGFQPKIVFVDENNHIKSTRMEEIPGPFTFTDY